MRSEIGQLSLDHVLKERQNLNANITEAINDAAQDWVFSLKTILTDRV
jgi:regulator of protease activity HflC (stomatin/prohibitin superfamily)